MIDPIAHDVDGQGRQPIHWVAEIRDAIIMKADELSGGQPFDSIDALISAEELRAISDHYKAVAGFALPGAGTGR